MLSLFRQKKSPLLITAAATLIFGIAACGGAGSSGTDEPQAVSGDGCAPVAGTELVALTDDKKLQNADNIVAAINTSAATPELIAAVDKVAAALDTTQLIALRKAVEVDRQTASQAAQTFADQSGLTGGLTGGSGEIKVGAANFSESEILAELYKIALNGAGFTASVQTIGNRELYEAALERNEIQVFPEYAATMTEFLNQKVNGEGAEPKASGDLDATMTALRELGTGLGLTFGTPSAAADQNAFAVTKAFANEHAITSLSDFAEKCSGKDSVLAGPPECPERPFCQVGLKDTYGIDFGTFHQADAGGPQTKTALTTGVASLGLVFSSDPSLS